MKKEFGVKGFGKGLGARLIRLPSIAGASWFIYEEITRMFGT